MTLSALKRGQSGRWLIALFAAPALMLLLALPARAAIDCLPLGQPLPPVPELVSHNGVLRGTILLSDEQERIATREPGGVGNIAGKPGLFFVCNPQYMRTFRGVDAWPPLPPVPPNQYADPVPGPTLRARVGDIVELSFINQINTGDFGNSIDQAENGENNGCDSSSAGYPGTPHSQKPPVPKFGGDAFPDCFHGSSTGNIHFHGTHVNVTGTGDNVFLAVRPLPRDNRGNLTVKPDDVTKQFGGFFKACEERLGPNPLLEWPQTWTDAPLGPWTKGNPRDPKSPPDPNTWTGLQALLLQNYDKGRPPAQQLWPVDAQQIEMNQWPQYYIGAFPYCYRIPEYTSASWPPPPPPPGGHRLIMGQAPGTHWYHAHKHGSTDIDVANGMTGVFIIEGKYDDDLNAWYGPEWTRHQPVLVINQLGVSPNLLRNGPGTQDKGADFSVNGRMQPVLEMRPGEVQLWRIANTSGRSGAFFLGPPPGFKWRQIAQDGVQFADQNYKASENKPFLMAAGNRVDLLVMAPTLPAVYPVVVQHDVDASDLTGAYPLPLFSVRVSADAKPVTGQQAQFIPTAPKQPPFLADITDAEVQSTINNPRVLAFSGGTAKNGPNSYAQHSINGMQFNDDMPPWKVKLDTAEEWKITNGTVAISHPFHIHLNPFQVVEIFNPNETITVNKQIQPKYVFYNQNLLPGQCYLNANDPSTWKPCASDTASTVPQPRIWWDVFPIPSGLPATDQKGNPINDPNGNQIVVPGYFKMRSRFVDYPGWYVMHCHILAHEDRGMMMTVSLEPAGAAPVAHMPFMHH
jgi:FtsP/CotA-like multicopper oxidase with cupredoxin domain